MVFNLFKQNAVTGDPGGIDYLMDNSTARVIWGNPEITRAVINASPPLMPYRHTAGVLNGCPQMTLAEEQSLIKQLEQLLLAGRGRESMPWCVIEHMNKGKKEKHVVIPNYDPVFRKVLFPYIDRIDRHGFRAWVDLYNLSHGLPSPNDRLRVTPCFDHLRLADEHVEFLRQIWQAVEFWVRGGLMKSREDLEPLLIGAGFKVRCNKHAGGPLEQPVVIGPGGKNLRLTGSTYYRPDFGISTKKPIDPEDPDAIKKKIEELQEELRRKMEFRAWHLIGRIFGNTEKSRVKLGESRKHMFELVQARMSAERRALRHVVPVNLANMIQMADAAMERIQTETREDKTSDAGPKVSPTKQRARSMQMDSMGLSMEEDAPPKRRKRKVSNA